MEFRRMIFEQKQPVAVVCKSGRAMIALNEQVVKTIENVPVGMDESGDMSYEEREKEQYAYDVCWIDGVSSEEDVLIVRRMLCWRILLPTTHLLLLMALSSMDSVFGSTRRHV